MFFPGDGPEKFFVDGPVSGIDASVTDHLKVLFGDMTDKTFDEIQSRQGFFDIGLIFMAVVMESDVIPIIFINA